MYIFIYGKEKMNLEKWKSDRYMTLSLIFKFNKISKFYA